MLCTMCAGRRCASHGMRCALGCAPPRRALVPRPAASTEHRCSRIILACTRPSQLAPAAKISKSAADMQLPCPTLVACTSSRRAACRASPPARRAGSSSLEVNSSSLHVAQAMFPAQHVLRARSLLACGLTLGGVGALCRSTIARCGARDVGHYQENQPVCACALSSVLGCYGGPHDGPEPTQALCTLRNSCRDLSWALVGVFHFSVFYIFLPAHIPSLYISLRPQIYLHLKIAIYDWARQLHCHTRAILIGFSSLNPAIFYILGRTCSLYLPSSTCRMSGMLCHDVRRAKGAPPGECAAH